MKSWKKIALAIFLGTAFIISLALISWVRFSDSDMQIESEKEIRITANDAKYITLTEENFQSEVLESTQPVLVDFWAEWCGPCHAIAPVIEEVAVDFEGRAKVGKLEVDDHTSIAMQYGIRSIPTVLFFKDGQVVDEVTGIAPKKVIADKLNALVAEEVALAN